MVQTALMGIVVAPAIYHFLLIPLRRKTIREERLYQSLHDPLTGLPNRNLFNEILAHELKAASRNTYQLAVAIIDPSSMSEIISAAVLSPRSIRTLVGAIPPPRLPCPLLGTPAFPAV